MNDDKRVENRALQLQAQGPDEFPFGYYCYLARIELGLEDVDGGQQRGGAGADIP